MRFASSGGELAVEVVGEGEALLLIHGFPRSSSMWRDLVPLFAARFRVIVPDLLGAGASDMPLDAALGIEAQARYLRELLDDLGVERVALVGHAEGGGVAQVLALDDPRVAALVLLDPIAFDAWPSATVRSIQATPEEDETAETMASSIEAVLREGIGHADRPTDQVRSDALQPWLRPGGAGAFFRFARSLDGRGLAGRERDLAAWEMPVLLLWGEDDVVVPVAIAERLQDAMPSSSLGLLPGCGHLLVEDAAETIGPMIVEYLRARYLRLPHGHEPGGVVMLQLERRPAWVDLEEYEREDEEPRVPDAATQEVGSAFRRGPNTRDEEDRP